MKTLVQLEVAYDQYVYIEVKHDPEGHIDMTAPEIQEAIDSLPLPYWLLPSQFAMRAALQSLLSESNPA